jgi:hypothetical protein
VQFVNGNSRLLAASAALLAGAGLVAAAAPSALSQAQGGLWEVSRAGSPPVRLCLANPQALAQFEHRNARCSRSVVKDSGLSTTFHYTCAGGAFGQTDITVVTPRSLRLETQGITGDGPFKYVFQARRVSDCPGH